MVMSEAPGWRRVKAYGTILAFLSMAARPMARLPANEFQRQPDQISS